MLCISCWISVTSGSAAISSSEYPQSSLNVSMVISKLLLNASRSMLRSGLVVAIISMWLKPELAVASMAATPPPSSRGADG
eukprot:CAMPEP_0115713746 /NCGR_PEP_ID=MMETSP0272-20121206/74837_1 /TAXON_ID=71861 /ORGANISM="Scrippsiella trochoidea, Strain CCMP3099" /LENGTH=80 /DNA_ID=CAMNT_0003155779 /DNA_START=179 /DNA_END=421 /DNA_ORIENTATION=-